MAQEYLWRALIDWARAAGGAVDATVLSAARAALADDDRGLLRQIVERDVLGADAMQWFERQDVHGFETWIARGATSAACFLGQVQRDGPATAPPTCAAAAPGRRRGAADCRRAGRRCGLRAAADFDGRPAETGAVARQARQPLVAALSEAFGRSTLVRLAARLSELARIACGFPPAAPLTGSLQPGVGRGLGWVETARGCCCTSSSSKASRSAATGSSRRRVELPSAGGAGRGHARRARDEPRRPGAPHRVAAAVARPCVAYRLEIGHA